MQTFCFNHPRDIHERCIVSTNGIYNTIKTAKSRLFCDSFWIALSFIFLSCSWSLYFSFVLFIVFISKKREDCPKNYHKMIIQVSLLFLLRTIRTNQPLVKGPNLKITAWGPFLLCHLHSLMSMSSFSLELFNQRRESIQIRK